MVLLELPFVLLTPDYPLAPHDREPFSWRRLASSYWLSPRQYPDFGWAWLTRFLTSLAIAMGTLYLLYFLRDAVHYARLFPGQTAADGPAHPDPDLHRLRGGRLDRRRGDLGPPRATQDAGHRVRPADGRGRAAADVRPDVDGGAGRGGAVTGWVTAPTSRSTRPLITQVLPAARDRAKDLGIINIAIVCRAPSAR